MTQEQKARAYDEALKLARDYHEDKNCFEYLKGVLEHIFYELQESEDERIRKWIIDDIRCNMNNEPLNNSEYKKKAEKAIAWLEKQGEQRSKLVDFDYNANDSDLQEVTYFIPNGFHAEIDGNKVVIKQGESKPVAKVKPKYHEGDWVVISTSDGRKVVKVVSIEYYLGGQIRYITSEGRWFGNGTKARLLTDKDVEITTIPESKAIVNKIKSWSKEDEEQ